MDTIEQLFVNKLLAAIAEYKASDLHLVVGNYPILRVNNKLMPLSDEQTITNKFISNIVDNWLNEKQKKQLAIDKAIVFTYTTTNKMRFRAGIYYQKGTLSISLKLIPEHLKTLDELGIPLAVQQIIDLKKGLVIIAGPFGSGKTTTISALIETINNNSSRHIITIEKPIEYLFSDNQSIIEQREIGVDTPSTLEALQFIADEDVDVVALYTMAGHREIEEVFKVIDSGRLVFAAVDAESVTQVLESIIDNFPVDERIHAQTRLANILVGISVQKVIPSLQGGVVLASELFFPQEDQTARAIIQAGEFAKTNNVLDSSQKAGMISFDRCLSDLVNNGQISLATALENANNKEYFRSLIGNR